MARSFTVGTYRFEVLTHQRVMGEDFPRSDPGAISEWFEIDCFRADGSALDLYPNHNPHPHPDMPNRLTIGWVGREVLPVLEAGVQVGTKQGADFRTRFWPSVMRRVLKAEAGRFRGVRIGEVLDADFAIEAALTVLPADFRARTRAQAIRDLTGEAPRVSRSIPRGTVANIEAAFDSFVNDAGTEDETGTEIVISLLIDLGAGSKEHRGQLRFSLSSLATGATVNDSDIQFNVMVEQLETGEGVNVHAYNSTGDDDPDADIGSTKYTRSVGGAALVGIDCSTTGSKTGDLGATADGQIQGNIDSPDIYSLGLAHLLQDSNEYMTIETIENAGTDPATLTVDYTTTVSLSGSLPAMSGALSLVKYEISTAGALPAMSGSLSSALTFFVGVSGDLPAMSGGLSLTKYLIALSGDLPAMSGALAYLQLSLNLSGNLPAMSGALSLVKYLISLSGDLPAQSGALSLIKYLISLSGDLPAQSGGLSLIKYLIALSGDLPAQSGAISPVPYVVLAGDLPAMSGALVVLLLDVHGSLSHGFISPMGRRIIPARDRTPIAPRSRSFLPPRDRTPIPPRGRDPLQ